MLKTIILHDRLKNIQVKCLKWKIVLKMIIRVFNSFTFHVTLVYFTFLENMIELCPNPYSRLRMSTFRQQQGSKLAVVRWSGTTKKSNGPAKYKFQWSAGPVTFNFSLFLFFFLLLPLVIYVNKNF